MEHALAQHIRDELGHVVGLPTPAHDDALPTLVSIVGTAKAPRAAECSLSTMRFDLPQFGSLSTQLASRCSRSVMERNNVRDAVTIEHYWKETIMLDVPSAFDNLRRSDDLASAQAYARLAGVLLLLSIVAGGFGEVYVPARLIVPADATATADNIAALGWLFRLGFAVYLVEAVCDVALVLLFYALLRPVDKYLALLAALFGLMATAVFGTSELFYFAASLVLRGDKYLGAFAPEQLRALALLSFKVYGYGAQIFMVFYGVAAGLRGWLILRSGYLPRFLGWILALAGLGFVAQNFAVVLAPAYASNALVLPMLLAGLSLAGWLLAKGVDPSGWEAKAAARCSPASQPSS